LPVTTASPSIPRPDRLRAAFLIGRAKSVHSFAFLRPFAVEASLSSGTNNAQTSPQSRTRFAFSRRGPCVPSRSALGCRMHFIRFVTGLSKQSGVLIPEAWQQARDSGHSPLCGPARGRSPRARISNLCSSSTRRTQCQRQSFIYGAADHCAGFSLSRCVPLALNPTLKSVSLTRIR
jgi:hypothetical protein